MTTDKKEQLKKVRFLKLLGETGNISQAARMLDCSRTDHYKWMASDRECAASAITATEESVDRLEQEARRRGMEGVAEPVYQGGKKVGVIQRYSDTLLIFLLKGAAPDKN